MQIVTYTPNMQITWGDPGEVDLCRHISNDCEQFFDVGARTSSHIVNSVYDPKKTYHLFEPVPEFVAALYQVYGRHPNIHINEFGLGSTETKLDYYAKSQSFINRPHAVQDKPSSQLTITTLDNYCAKNNVDRIDFLKIDTEGFELEVLKGAKKMLEEDKVRYVQFEYGGTYPDAKITLKDVVDCFLADWKLYLLQDKKLLMIPTSLLPHVATCQYSNFLITKRL